MLKSMPETGYPLRSIPPRNHTIDLEAEIDLPSVGFF